MIHFTSVSFFLSRQQLPFTLSQDYKTPLVNVISTKKERGKLPPLEVLNSGSGYSLIRRETKKGKFWGNILGSRRETISGSRDWFELTVVNKMLLLLLFDVLSRRKCKEEFLFSKMTFQPNTVRAGKILTCRCLFLLATGSRITSFFSLL